MESFISPEAEAGSAVPHRGQRTTTLMGLAALALTVGIGIAAPNFTGAAKGRALSSPQQALVSGGAVVAAAERAASSAPRSPGL
jgi:hypothetical protein